MQRAVMGLYADLGAPLLPLVFASDAEGAQDSDAGGYGIVVAAANSEIVEKLWDAGTKPGVAVAKPGQLQKVLERGPETLQPHLPVIPSSEAGSTAKLPGSRSSRGAGRRTTTSCWARGGPR